MKKSITIFVSKFHWFYNLFRCLIILAIKFLLLSSLPNFVTFPPFFSNKKICPYNFHFIHYFINHFVISSYWAAIQDSNCLIETKQVGMVYIRVDTHSFMTFHIFSDPSTLLRILENISSDLPPSESLGIWRSWGATYLSFSSSFLFGFLSLYLGSRSFQPSSLKYPWLPPYVR